MDIFSEIGLSEKEVTALLGTGVSYLKTSGARQALLGEDDEGELTGILLDGVAFLESINLENQRRILDCYEAGDVFDRKSFPDVESRSYYVVSAQKGTRALFVHENRLDRAGAPGRKLSAFLAGRASCRSRQRALLHVDILGQRTLRQKLLAYFAHRAGQGRPARFLLPFSLTDCADYLGVDRSAMMRELKKMKEEGLVLIQGRTVRLER